MKRVVFVILSYRNKTYRRLTTLISVMVILGIILSGCLWSDEYKLSQDVADGQRDNNSIEENMSSLEKTDDSLKSSTPSSTPEPTVTPTPTPTPKPTATPTPKPTATPTPKPTATPTSKPTATPTPTPTSAPSSVDDVQGSYNSSYAQEVLVLVNNERTAEGLDPLVWAQILRARQTFAQKKSLLNGHTHVRTAHHM